MVPAWISRLTRRLMLMLLVAGWQVRAQVTSSYSAGREPAQSAAEGWKALSTLHESGPVGDERRNALHKAIELSNYQFNAHGIELGYRYRSDVIVDDSSPDPTPVRDPTHPLLFNTVPFGQ
jgi:hypothetical protein